MGLKPSGVDGMDIRATPSDESDLLVTIFGRTVFATGRSATDGKGATWANVLIPPGVLDGWVRGDQVAEAPDPGFVPVDPEMFVRQCTLVDRTLNADQTIPPNYVTADFLIARAIIETGMTQTRFEGQVLDGIMRLTQAEWDAFQKKSGLEVAASFSDADARYPLSQVYAAGFSMHADGKVFAEVAAGGPGAAADDPLVPSYLDLFHCHLTDPATAFALKQNESDATKTLAGLGVSTLQAAEIAKRPHLGQVTGDTTIPAFFALTEPLLSEALDGAFAKISTLAPDELPSSAAPQAGPGAPSPTSPAAWFNVAAKEEVAKISEASNPDRVRSYFAATDHGAVGAGAIPAWCGAFAAFCMHQVGGPIPKASALAVSWKSWGQKTVPVQSHTIPNGAVVVMAPSPGTGSTGHVAFFVDTSHDGQHLTLLGGNQSNAVTRSQGFRVSRVAIIRTLESDSVSIGAANGFDMTAAGVPKELQPFGDRIVDRFTRAGLNRRQHLVTALANAIAESGLRPDAEARGGEHSYGLFQCNRTHGLGIGFTVAQLKDADTNIGIVIKAARSVSSFVSAATVEAAMTAFVRFVERPLDQAGAVKARLAIVHHLL